MVAMFFGIHPVRWGGFGDDMFDDVSRGFQGVTIPAGNIDAEFLVDTREEFLESSAHIVAMSWLKICRSGYVRQATLQKG